MHLQGFIFKPFFGFYRFFPETINHGSNFLEEIFRPAECFKSYKYNKVRRWNMHIEGIIFEPPF